MERFVENYDELDGKIFDTGLVIFTRDLRIADNYLLEVAGLHCKNLILCFQFRQKQINPEKNKYFSHFSVKFMCESLDDLYKQTNGKLLIIGDKISNKINYDAIFISKDYTDYAINVREKELRTYTDNLFLIHNHLLEPPLTTTPCGGKSELAYTKFTPYYNAANKSYKPLIVNSARHANKFIKPSGIKVINSKEYHSYYELEDYQESAIIGGRNNAKKILKFIKKYKNYKKDRDIPANSDGTTRLSAHNKFGTVSIREVYTIISNAFSKNHDLIRQLWWREFYYNIAISFPHVTQGESLKADYDKIKWDYPNDSTKVKQRFNAWKNGETGFEFVDAGMKQLTTTGYMHNRLRLVTASFLIKDLHIDWREGERFFARYLVDHDPIMNNGNWQWTAGSGADSQPFFRIFNPDSQLEKFDKDKEYIDTYVDEEHEKIIEHNIERDKSISMYKKALYN